MAIIEADFPAVEIVVDGKAGVHPCAAGHTVGMVYPFEPLELPADELPEIAFGLGVSIDFNDPVPVGKDHAIEPDQNLLLVIALFKNSPDTGFQFTPVG